jgi:hypothetical protein
MPTRSSYTVSTDYTADTDLSLEYNHGGTALLAIRGVYSSVTTLFDTFNYGATTFDTSNEILEGSGVPASDAMGFYNAHYIALAPATSDSFSVKVDAATQAKGVMAVSLTGASATIGETNSGTDVSSNFTVALNNTTAGSLVYIWYVSRQSDPIAYDTDLTLLDFHQKSSDALGFTHAIFEYDNTAGGNLSFNIQPDSSRQGHWGAAEIKAPAGGTQVIWMLCNTLPIIAIPLWLLYNMIKVAL